MDAFLSAVLGDLTTRSIRFFASKISKPDVPDTEDRLRRVLLRAEAIVEEATGRRITNEAMLLQLDTLRDAVHRGCYTLDAFRYRSHDDEEGSSNDMAVSRRSSSLRRVNSLKSFGFSGRRDAPRLQKLQEAFDELSSVILDLDEFMVFLMSYPRRYRQPYSMHLVLGNCMFGNQLEAGQVVRFLLHSRPHPRGAKELEVLPIVGPAKVGKSTLVAHVCKDERVRGHFTEIIFLHNFSFTDDELATFREACAIRHQHRAPSSNKEDGRSAVVVETQRDVNQDAWIEFYSTLKRYLPNGSKIIVTSRSDKIVKFGTTQTLNLKHPSREAYWYFFKTLAFGSTDPEMDPRFASLAMEIASAHDGTLFRASIAASLLRENFDTYFWCKVLAFLRLIQKPVSRYDEHPFTLTDLGRPVCFRIRNPSKDFLIYHQYHQRSSEEEVPKVKITDVLHGDAKPQGKFEALAWRSPIPPYHSYVYTCEIGEPKPTAIKRKRSVRDEVALC